MGVRAVSELYHQPGADPIGRTVAVIGAKGGVGASTLRSSSVSRREATVINQAFGLAGSLRGRVAVAGRLGGTVCRLFKVTETASPSCTHSSITWSRRTMTK